MCFNFWSTDEVPGEEVFVKFDCTDQDGMEQWQMDVPDDGFDIRVQAVGPSFLCRS